MSELVALPVVIPLLAAGITLMLGRFPRTQASVAVASLTAVLGVSLALLIDVGLHGPLAVDVGGWPAPFGIVLVADGLATLMLVVAAVVTLGVLIYSVGQGNAAGDADTPVSIFYPTYLIMAAGVSDAFVAGDLFNLYVGFEILLAASYVLLTLGGTESRIRAGVTYVLVSLVSSVIFLVGIGFVYGATGTVNMAQLSVRLAQLPPDVQMLLHITLLVAFGIKAAVFPLSFWLPDSYPTAPAPVTAVFAGLLTKVGVYAMIRTETVLFPDGRLNTALMMVAGLTLLVGILGAIAQTDIKRLLSFTLVSHIGYMVFGIALGSRAGVAAAIYYVVHHIIVQTGLFLAAGLIERRSGSTSLLRLGGLAKLSPVLGVLFFIPAVNLGGIPPLSGFLGKLGLFEAGAEAGGWLAYALIGAGALTSLLTLYVIGRVWNYAFWRDPIDAKWPESGLVDEFRAATGRSTPRLPASAGPARSMDGGEPPDASTTRNPNSDKPDRRLPVSMVGATAGMVAVGLLLTVLAGPLYDIAEDAAEAVRSGQYVSLVLGGRG